MVRPATFRAARLAATAVLGASALVGCSLLPGDPTSSAGPTASSPTPVDSPAPTPSAKPKPVRNDLKERKVQRVVKVGDVSLTVRYTTPARTWTTSGEKYIAINVTARTTRSTGDPKFWMSATKVNLALFDDAGPLDSPAALTDQANNFPGFLMNFPESYGATFTVPSVNVGATSLKMTFLYSVVSEVPKTKTEKEEEDETTSTQRNFTKQTAIDTIVVPLTS